MKLHVPASTRFLAWLLSLVAWPAVAAPQNPDISELLAQAGKARQERRMVEAEKLYMTALEEAQKLGPDNPKVRLVLNNLGNFYMGNEQHAKAEPLYLRVVEIHEKNLGPNHVQAGNALQQYAELLRLMGREAEGASANERAQAILGQYRKANPKK